MNRFRVPGRSSHSLKGQSPSLLYQMRVTFFRTAEKGAVIRAAQGVLVKEDAFQKKRLVKETTAKITFLG